MKYNFRQLLENLAISKGRCNILNFDTGIFSNKKKGKSLENELINITKGRKPGFNVVVMNDDNKEYCRIQDQTCMPRKEYRTISCVV